MECSVSYTHLDVYKRQEEGVTAEKMVCADMPELNYAFMISGFDHLNALSSFREGLFYVQDVSSMMVAETVAPKKDSYIIDVCAAPDVYKRQPFLFA